MAITAGDLPSQKVPPAVLSALTSCRASAPSPCASPWSTRWTSGRLDPNVGRPVGGWGNEWLMLMVLYGFVGDSKSYKNVIICI